MGTDVQLDGFQLLLAGCELKPAENNGQAPATSHVIKIPGYPYLRGVDLIEPCTACNLTMIHFSMGGDFRIFLRAWCIANRITFEEY